VKYGLSTLGVVGQYWLDRLGLWRSRLFREKTRDTGPVSDLQMPSIKGQKPADIPPFATEPAAPEQAKTF